MPLLKWSSLTGERIVFISEPNNVSGLSLRIGLDEGEHAKHCPDGGI